MRAVLDGDGERLASIWRDRAGRIFLPFDPDEVVRNYWTEAYKSGGTGGSAGRRALMRANARLRPLLPRALQIALRRRFARVQARARFPRWPAESGLHDFFDVAYALLAEIAGGPVPRIAAWPDGHEWALVLTHDVEQTLGYEALDPVLAIERAQGVRWPVNRPGVQLDPCALVARPGVQLDPCALVARPGVHPGVCTLVCAARPMRPGSSTWSAAHNCIMTGRKREQKKARRDAGFSGELNSSLHTIQDVAYHLCYRSTMRLGDFV